MLAALAAAPVSLVQPVAAFGLVLLAGFSHFVLKVGLVGGAQGGVLAALAAAPVSLVQPVAAFGLVLLAGFSHFVVKVGLAGLCAQGTGNVLHDNDSMFHEAVNFAWSGRRSQHRDHGPTLGAGNCGAVNPIAETRLQFVDFSQSKFRLKLIEHRNRRDAVEQNALFRLCANLTRNIRCATRSGALSSKFDAASAVAAYRGGRLAASPVRYVDGVSVPRSAGGLCVRLAHSQSSQVGCGYRCHRRDIMVVDGDRAKTGPMPPVIATLGGGGGNPRIRRCQLARDGATVPISKPNCDSQSLVRPSLVDDSLTKVGILSTIDEILRQSVRIIVRL
jgi:hypothetical protein